MSFHGITCPYRTPFCAHPDFFPLPPTSPSGLQFFSHTDAHFFLCPPQTSRRPLFTGSHMVCVTAVLRPQAAFVHLTFRLTSLLCSHLFYATHHFAVSAMLRPACTTHISLTLHVCFYMAAASRSRPFGLLWGHALFPCAVCL